MVRVLWWLTVQAGYDFDGEKRKIKQISSRRDKSVRG